MDKYLKFNSEELPRPTSYEIQYEKIIVSKETEAGTEHRDIIRESKIFIDVSFLTTKVWAKKFSNYNGEEKINVEYFDLRELELTSSFMYIDGFKIKLFRHSVSGSLWEVNFTLVEI